MDTSSLNANARALLAAIQKPTYVSETPPPGTMSVRQITKALGISKNTVRRRLSLINAEKFPVMIRDSKGMVHKEWFYKLKV